MAIVIAILIPWIMAGIVVRWMTYLYSEKRRIRRIIEYAQESAHQGQLVREAALRGDSESLRTMAGKEIHGLLAGSKENRTHESEELQKAIALCNERIDILSSVVLLSTYEDSLSRAEEDLRVCILKLWEAITAYDDAEEKTIKVRSKTFLLVILYLMLLEVIIIVLVSS
jgi:hypothetical protein